MVKNFLRKIWHRFWRRQDKKLGALQKSVNNLQKSVSDLQKTVNDMQKSTNELQKKLNEQKKQNQDLKNQLERRDNWAVRSAELRYLAKGKKIWVIKNPAPDSPNKLKWGEYQFYLDLKKELEAQGYFVYIDYHDNWKGPIDADFVLVSLCDRKYRPDRRMKNCKYILWVNCFPDNVEKEDYELYDCILVSSHSYAEKIADETSVPVKTFLLCVDTKKFYPKETELKYNKVFVGNTRGVTRDCITWCDNNHIEVNLWGNTEGPNGWANRIKEGSSVKLEGFLPNEELPNVYRASKIVLNNHFGDMRREGFINLRTVEALFCGCAILSDYHHELENIFGDSIVYYRDEEEFLQKLAWLEEHYEEQRQKVLDIWPKLQKEFSLEERAKMLAKIAEEL